MKQAKIWSKFYNQTPTSKDADPKNINEETNMNREEKLEKAITTVALELKRLVKTYESIPKIEVASLHDQLAKALEPTYQPEPGMLVEARVNEDNPWLYVSYVSNIRPTAGGGHVCVM